MNRKHLIPALLFLVSFFIYLKSLSPAFHADDSPETITAGYTLSVQHPPGYPLHSLLGRAACLILPGSPAFQVNQLSALCGAISLVLLFAIFAGLIREWGLFKEGESAGQVFALLAALGTGLTLTLWFQAGIAKGGIYTLNLLLTLAALLSVLAARQKLLGLEDATLSLGLAGLFWGLGFANHWTSQIVLAPCFFLLLLPAWRDSSMGIQSIAKGLGACLFFFILGLTLYFYLPIRVSQGVVLQWGEPNTWTGFWWLFSRSQYATIEGTRSLWTFLGLLKWVGHDCVLEFHPLGLAVLGLGWAWILRRKTWLGLALLAWPLVLVAAVCYAANPPQDSLWVIDPYLLSAYAGLAIGIMGLPGLAAEIGVDRGFAVGLALVGALGLGIWHKQACDQSNDFLAYDYANNLLLSCPENALLFCEGDSNTAGPLYPLFVRGKRRDIVQVIDVLLDYPWYEKNLARLHPGLKTMSQPLGVKADLDFLAVSNPARPFIYTNSFTPAWVDEKRVIPRGLCFARDGQGVAPWPEAEVAANDLMPAYETRGVFPPAQYQDAITQRLVTSNYYADLAKLGEAYQARGKLQRAESVFVKLGKLKPLWEGPWLQAGNMAYFRGDLERAGDLWKRALKENPLSPLALANLGLYHLRRGEWGPAQDFAQQALDLDPSFASARQIAGQALAGLKPAPPGAPDSRQAAADWAVRGDKAASAGNAKEALKCYDQALKLGFENAALRRNRAVMRLKQGDKKGAALELEKSLRLDPASVEVKRYLAAVDLELGKKTEAIGLLKELVAVDPGDAQSGQLLKQAQAQ